MRLAAVVLLLLAGPAFAKGEEALVRLQSETPSVRAWGAYLAGKEGVAEAVPRLIDLIRAVPDYKDKEGRLVVRASFDALIRLKAAVPADVLEPHLSGRFAAQALILLTRAPKIPPALLLKLFDKQGGENLGQFGIAVGNVLCEKKVPGFASRLFGRVNLKLNVSLVDEGNLGFGVGGSIGGRFGDGRLDIPPGFPPTVFYRLADRERKGAVLLADGPRPISWYRQEKTGERIGFGSSSSSIAVEKLAREWIAVLSGVPEKELGIRATSSTSLVWSDAEAYKKHVAARRNAILAQYWKLVTTLLTKQILTLDEARALKPVVTVKVRDARRDPAAKLPELPQIPAPPERPDLPGEDAPSR